MVIVYRVIISVLSRSRIFVIVVSRCRVITNVLSRYHYRTLVLSLSKYILHDYICLMPAFSSSYYILFSSHNLSNDGLLVDGTGHSYPCQTLTGFSKLTICPGDVIPEDTALSFPSCRDVNLAADAGKSVISLSGIVDVIQNLPSVKTFQKKQNKNVSLLKETMHLSVLLLFLLKYSISIYTCSFISRT